MFFCRICNTVFERVSKVSNQMYLNDGLIMFQEAKLHQRRTVSMSAPQILVKLNTCDKCNRSWKSQSLLSWGRFCCKNTGGCKFDLYRDAHETSKLRLTLTRLDVESIRISSFPSNTQQHYWLILNAIADTGAKIWMGRYWSFSNYHDLPGSWEKWCLSQPGWSSWAPKFWLSLAWWILLDDAD